MSKNKGIDPKKDDDPKDGEPTPPVEPPKGKPAEPTPPAKPADDTPPAEPTKPELPKPEPTPPAEPPAEPSKPLVEPTKPGEEPAFNRETLKKEIKDEIVAEDAEAEKAHQTQIDNIRSGWSNEYSALAKAGKVPKIKDIKDEKDPGVKTKRALLIKLGEIIRHNKQAGVEQVPNISQVLLLHPEVLKPPPGGNLPIAGAGSIVNDGEGFSNAEIRGKSIQEIAKESAP